MRVAESICGETGVALACRSLGVSRAGQYRRRERTRREALAPASLAPVKPRPSPPRTLDAPERQTVLDVLHCERFVDKAGHQCAYYDQTLLFPVQAFADKPTPGVAVLDMTDPAHPVRTATLVTPAMQTPHESVLVNQ